MSKTNLGCFIGVDPGKNGGLAALDTQGHVISVVKMPETDTDIWQWFDQFKWRERFALLEKVHSMPHQGVVSMFTFGTYYGLVRMALTASQTPFEEVTPQCWQKSYSLLWNTGTKLEPSQKKVINKAKAQGLFPKEKVTHALADALLIAEYCRRVQTKGLYDE
jgi:crossover junction endodeoxyribonuclease RuvC